MRNISSFVQLLIVALVGAGTIKPAPFSSNTCFFGDDFNYTAGETWHPFLNPNGYDCIKCSCVIKTHPSPATSSSSPNKIATIKCNRLCNGTTCSASYGKCCTNCQVLGIFDKNQNGVIDFDEFAALWLYVTDWQKAFRSFDTDNSGTLDMNELKTGPLSGRAYKYQTCTNQQGHKYSHNAIWAEPPKDPSLLKSNECTECSCWDGFITCAIRTCSRLTCTNPRSQRGTCCKTCSQGVIASKMNGCYTMARFYEEGAIWYPQIPSYQHKCLQCQCKKNSVVTCHPLKCPATKCDKPFRLHPGDCCKVCSENRTNMTTTQPPVISPTMPGVQDPFPNCTRFSGNKVYANGSEWHPVFGNVTIRCVICKCLNGNIMCGRINCPSCPNCQGSFRSPLRNKPCSPSKYWRIMQYVYLRPKLYFRTIKVKFALVRYPVIEFYMVRDENKASQTWQVNHWKLQKTLRHVDLIRVLNSVAFLQGGHFKETGILWHGEQRDGLRQLVFKQCTSNCAAQVQQVDNYLNIKSKVARKRQCRSVPSVPRTLQMLTEDD